MVYGFGRQNKRCFSVSGIEKIVKAAGGTADDAVKMLISDKIEQLVATQVEAVKGINIDKVTVWDSMGGKNGESTTANFISSMLKAVPPLNEVFKMSGMKLPEYLGKVEEPAQTDNEENDEQ